MVSRGDRNIQWIESCCRVPEGKLTGQPVRLREWQCELIRDIYNSPTRRYIVSFPRKSGKCLDISTPIPTREGWKPLAEIREGDFVFDETGRSSVVTFVSETYVGKKSWKLTFSDGSEIIADEDHQWVTTHSHTPWKKRRVNGSGNGGNWKTGIVTTPQIAQSLLRPRRDGGKESNHKLQVNGRIEFSERELPLSPYVLGYWLGNGGLDRATVTCSWEDAVPVLKELEKEVGRKLSYLLNVNSAGNRSCTIKLTNAVVGEKECEKLRGLGVFSDKFIPKQYLESSVEQRLALLQGLMDSDGTVTRSSTRSYASFCNMNESMVRTVWQLVRSLGIKATITSREAKLNGRCYGTAWLVNFFVTQEMKVFRLARKQNLLPLELGKRSSTITIVSCEEVPSVPTKCISVDSPNRMYLAGYGCIPTHNTAISSFLLLLHLCGPEAQRNSQLYSAATSREQAAVLFNLAAKCVRQSPQLVDFVHVKDSTKILECKGLGTVYRALSADASTAYGLSPVFIVHDELGQVKGPRSELYEALESACAAHESPLSIIISTQAPTDKDLLSVLIDDALAGGDPKTKCRIWTAPLDLDPFCEETLRIANPAFGDFQSAEELLSEAAAAKRMPSKESSYRNLNLNQRVEQNKLFCSASVWKANGAMPQSGDWRQYEVYAGLDLSETSDLTAFVRVAAIDGIWHVRSTFWLPEDTIIEKSKEDRWHYDLMAEQGFIELTPGRAIEYEWVAERIYEIFQEEEICKCAFDRYNFRHLKPWLERAGFEEEDLLVDGPTKAEAKFVPFGQGFVSMTPALRSLETILLNNKMQHGMNPVLTFCASNCVAILDPAGNRKLSKTKSRGRIDGMVALAMAVGVAETAEKAETSVYADRGMLFF